MSWSSFFAHPAFIAVAPALTTGLLGWLALKYRTSQLEKSVDAKADEIERKKLRIEELERSGRDASAQDVQARAVKSALISKLNDVMELARASRSSLYIPVDDAEGDFLGLMILCTAPTNLADSSFHGTVFSGRDALVMRSFLDREIVTSEGSAFRFDQFSPAHTYSDCIFEKDKGQSSRPIAVVQLLFDEKHRMDQAECKAAIARISPGLVEDLQFFGSDLHNKLDMIDLNIPEQSRRGVVMFFDVSKSSQLFTNEAQVITTMTLMKRFMEVGVKTVVAQGGVIEGFTGDGFIASFTVNPRNVDATVFERALAAARNMIEDSLGELKKLRPELGDYYDIVQPRVGLATGVVHGISFAFGQMRVASVIGRSASNASIVCNTAPRDRACITIDSATLLELPAFERSNFVALAESELTRKAKDRRLSVFVSKPVDPI